VSGTAEACRSDLDRRKWIAAALRARWRMFERVSLAPDGDGEGFRATIYLNPTIVRGAAEQQGTIGRTALSSWAAERRQRAIRECVDAFNAELEPAERIRTYEVVDH
jgi:hypothetical protein